MHLPNFFWNLTFNQFTYRVLYNVANTVFRCVINTFCFTHFMFLVYLRASISYGYYFA